MTAYTAPGHQADSPDLRPDLSPGDRYRVTLDGIGTSARLSAAKARSVARTIDALNDAFAGITGEGNRESFSGFGLIGLPLMATWAAIKKAAEQYVGRTGKSLKDWTIFVAEASEQFDEYISVLDSLAAFAVSQSGTASSTVDGADRERLRDARHATQAWKEILGRVSQIGQLVDAILAAQKSEESVVEDPSSDSRSKWPSKLHDRVTEAVSQTSLGAAELREWLFRPLTDLKEQVEQLPATVARLGEEVAMLEVKLELAIAQLEARTGVITTHDVEIMQLRVAGTVLLPGLMAELDRVESRRLETESHRTRLHDLHAAGEIGDEIHHRLDEMYTSDMKLIQEELSFLTDDMEAWRTDGSGMVDECLDWIAAELDLLRSRRLVEGDGHLDQRIALLDIEQQRLLSVRRFLDGENR